MTEQLNSNKKYIYTHTTFSFSIDPSVDGHLGCFRVLAIINNVVMHMGVHISFQDRDFISLGYLPRNGIITSYGKPISNVLRNLHCISQCLHQ